MSNPKPDLGSSGWIRHLPAAALRAYMGIWSLTQRGRPPLGGLDDVGAAAWVSFFAQEGLDQPYDPSNQWVDPDGAERERLRWKEWQGYAADRDRPLRSCRDLIEFMVELGLIEKKFEVEIGDVAWRIASPLPNVDEVLPLSAERQESEARIRWGQSFREAGDAITLWIAQRWPESEEESEIETSIEEIAVESELDPEDARHGLALLLDEDIRCDLNPETAGGSQALRITVDWRLFGDFRSMYRAAAGDCDAEEEP